MAQPNALCIDDDPSMAEMLSCLAAQAGFNTRITCKENFISAYSEFPADLIILDIFMLEQDGAALLEFLKERQCSAPLILISGAQEKCRIHASRMAKTLKLSLYAHVYKPFSPHSLHEILLTLERSLAYERTISRHDAA